MKLIFGFLFISISFAFSQTGYNIGEKKEDLNHSGAFNSYLNPLDIPAQKGLNFSIDEDEYFVGSGDVFLIKVDRKGPSIKVFNSSVSPDGFLLIPDIKGIYVRGKLLRSVKEKINTTLKNKYPDAIVETYLFSLHNIDITVLGLDNINSKMLFNSSNRLFDAYSEYIKGLQIDTTKHELLKRLSQRDIKLIRENSTKSYDLLEFKTNPQKELNPYLQHEDIIYFSLKDSLTHHVSVNGSVANPNLFEFKSGDNLKKALDFSGNLLANADSGNIIVTRFVDNSIKNIFLSFPKDSIYQLFPDDRIYIRGKKQYHVKSSVKIMGEVSFPGEYSIIDGEEKLKDIIDMAGGFTEDASLSQAKVLRDEGDFIDKEFERLNAPVAKGMNRTERSYYRLRNRENTRVVSCDFKKLFINGDSTQNVTLQDKDLIVVPKKTNNVYVSGGVLNPGIIAFNDNWTLENYIELAGGYSDRAKEGSVKIIRNKTGNWIDADDDTLIDENDIIFVPKRDELDLYDIMKEGLAISAQLATLVLIFLNLK